MFSSRLSIYLLRTLSANHDDEFMRIGLINTLSSFSLDVTDNDDCGRIW